MKNMTGITRMAMAIAGLVLGGCSVEVNNDGNGQNGAGGSSTFSSSGICQTLGGGNAQVDGDAPVDGGFSNLDSAFDGNLASYAGVTQALSSGLFRIRGTTQSGVVGAGGTTAGIAMNRLELVESLNVVISTYLDGVLQDRGSAGSQTGNSLQIACAGSCVNSGDLLFFGIGTTRAYDAIEAQVQYTGLLDDIRLHELCWR